MSRILVVVGERGGGILGRGEPVRVGYGAERRLSTRSDVDPKLERVVERLLPGHGELHEKIVLVLAVDQQNIVKGLAPLKELGAAPVGYGRSDFGFSYVYVIFEDGTDIYWARSGRS